LFQEKKLRIQQKNEKKLIRKQIKILKEQQKIKILKRTVEEKDENSNTKKKERQTDRNERPVLPT
jgi:hypothetical protein